jgi:Subtilase family
MGHGTEMAGLALYGDLALILRSAAPLQLTHRLESVKILPPTGANDPQLYGAITAEATSRIETQAPQRRRAFSLAVTAPDQRDRGQPTSWSSAIDALAAGRSFDPTRQGLVYLDNAEEGAHRLFVISAGNVQQLDVDHLVRSDLEVIHDPAQAWNALTVGACTDMELIEDPDWEDWEPLAPIGELSPWSTTSVSFARTWPIKPDVVFEGGNLATNGGGDIDFPLPDLSLLSTYFKPAESLFVLSWATSAATAQVARMAALVAAEYPDLWPETVRALIVHSAEWTRTMSGHLRGAAGKRARAALVRRYGFDVPDIARATKSANDALTLIAQNRIRPYEKGKMREMHIHQLPWPTSVLEGLAQTPVRLRVTLSYFIEPNPSRRGWIRRYRYPSHGLRFEVKAPEESIDEFRKRINERALEEDEHKPSAGDASDWFLGEQARNTGSLHSDFLVGTAADLAARSVIGIYPVSGWWKDQPKRDRSSIGVRYALIVSIETEAANVDIWTPVALEVGIAVEVPAQPGG